jgi:hypothetical protein
MRRSFFGAGVIILHLLAGGGLLAGCSSWYASLAARLTPSPSASFSINTQTAPVPEAAAAVETATPPDPADCAFVWSNRTLPDLSTEVNKAFRDQGYAEVQVEASAYGEDCLNTQTNAVVRFSALQTDFFVTVALDAVNDPQEMGEWVETVMRVLEAFPPGKAPGPNPGYVGVAFTDGTESVDLWFTRTRAANLVKEGLSGGELYDALISAQ